MSLTLFPPPQKTTFARPTFNVPSLDSLVQTSLSFSLSLALCLFFIVIQLLSITVGSLKRCRKLRFEIRASKFEDSSVYLLKKDHVREV